MIDCDEHCWDWIYAGSNEMKIGYLLTNHSNIIFRFTNLEAAIQRARKELAGKNMTLDSMKIIKVDSMGIVTQIVPLRSIIRIQLLNQL
jgi:hypothetical protein